MSDDRLRRLLSDAVSDIEPADRIDELRASVHPSPRVIPMARSRSWYAGVGIVATAAVIGVIAYLTSVVGDKTNHAGAASGDGTSPTTATATDTAAPPPAGDVRTYAVYYAGIDPKGHPVLFREVHRGPTAGPVGALALHALSGRPLDPDYATGWQPGWLRSARTSPTQDVILVTAAASLPAAQPAGMSPQQARITVQQVVYTLQAAFHDRLPVQFVRHGVPVARVLGVPSADPIGAGKVPTTLSLMSISAPNQGDVVRGSRLTVSGLNSGFEGTAAVWLERNHHRFLSKATIGGGYPDRLVPWSVTLNVSRLAPGTYTLVASNDDPTGQNKPARDTRVITIR